MNRGTLTQLFFTTVDRHAALPAAFRSKVGGAWVGITHRETFERVKAISLGLRELGIKPGDKVAIVSENRPEWALTDYACLCARAADVPVYPTLTAKQTEYILRDSESVAVFCSTKAQVDKVLEVRAGLPGLKYIIAYDADAAAGQAGITALAAVEAKGRAAASQHPKWKDEALSAGPDDLATLIYTSGTTGDPKGVMLTHHNLWSNVQAVLQMIPIGSGDECLSMLPLSHSYERMVDYTLFQAGVIINYAESFDTVAANLQEVKPTVVLSVPRLYEKVYARVLENALSGSAIKRTIFFWAKRTGEQWATLALAGLPIPGGLRFKKKIADRLVFAKLQARTGGRIRFFVSGAAPLSADIAKFFYSAGLPVIEGYGLTESSPVLTLNPLDRIKLGTVGRAIPGVELKIAPDGEILAHGPNIMQGYYKLDEATRETVDHRPQEGAAEDGGRQVHRAAADRDGGQAQQVRRERHAVRRSAQVPDHSDRPEFRQPRALGTGAQSDLWVSGPADRAGGRAGQGGARSDEHAVAPGQVRDAEEGRAAREGLHDRIW